MTATSRFIGPYEVLEKIGIGAIGTVYAVKEGDKQFAVKLMHSFHLGSEHNTNSYGNEFALLRSFSHPGVVEAYELLKEEDGCPYVVMELLKGDTLEYRMAHERKLGRLIGIPDALSVIIEVCKALEHVHQKGIVHRDIKPANIFVCDGGAVKLLDFGFSGPSGESDMVDGCVRGTPSYMSREQTKGENLNPETDIYSTGVILCEILLGGAYIRSTSVSELVRTIRKGVPTKDLKKRLLAVRSSEVVWRLFPVLCMALEPDLDHRLGSMTEFREKLEVLLLNYPDARGIAEWTTGSEAVIEDDLPPLLDLGGLLSGSEGSCVEDEVRRSTYEFPLPEAQKASLVPWGEVLHHLVWIAIIALFCSFFFLSILTPEGP